MCHKLTSKHVSPNTWQKMNVSLAVQAMSRQSAAAIETALALNVFPGFCKSKAKSTAAFFRKIDRVFDCLNSKSPFSDNIYKTGMRKEGKVRQFLNEIVEYLRNIGYKTPSKNQCVKGLIHSIRAIIGLCDYVFKQYSEKSFLLTSKLNQDILENLFALVRNMGGNKNNPSLDEFSAMMGRIMSQKIISFSAEGSNCQEDDAEFITNEDFSEMKNLNSSEFEDRIPNSSEPYTVLANEESDISVLLDRTQEEILEKSILNEDASLRYFAGYVVSRFFRRYECENCSKNLIKEGEIATVSQPTELLIFFRNYSNKSDFGNLYAPSDPFFEICKIFLYVFKVIFNECPQMKNIKTSIINKCVEKTRQYDKFSEWFSSDNPCRAHHFKLLDFFVLVLLRKHAQWTSKELPNKSERKLKILSNRHQKTCAVKIYKKRRVVKKKNKNITKEV